MVLQANGKIIAGGSTTIIASNQSLFALARYLSNGSLDTSFNGTGFVSTVVAAGVSLENQALNIQSDGKIIIAGTNGANFLIGRYNTNGSLDTTFGSSGFANTPIGSHSFADSVAIQSNGFIVAAGGALETINDFALARYTSTPILNPTVINTPVFVQPSSVILSGTAQNQSIVTIFIDGVDTATTITPLSTAVESDTLGTWSVTVGPFAPGPHTIIASANYKTSNVILNSAPLLICLNTVSIAPAIQIVCPGESINFIANTSGGNAPLNFTWTGPNGFSEDTGNNPTLTISNPTLLNTGSYTVTVTDSLGCQVTSQPAEVVVKAFVCS